MDGRKFRLTKKKEHIAYKCTVENHSMQRIINDQT